MKDHKLPRQSSRRVILSPTQDYPAQKSADLASSIATFLGLPIEDVLVLPAGSSVLVVDNVTLPPVAVAEPIKGKEK